MRAQQWETPATAARLLEDAGHAATVDPAGSQELIGAAIEAGEDAGLPCLVSRAVALQGFVLAVLDRLDESAEAFDKAKARFCPCCLPWIERLRTSLLRRQGREEEAERVARNALRLASSNADIALCHLTLGFLLGLAEKFDAACPELYTALEMFPLRSEYWGYVHTNLNTALAHSSDISTVREALRHLRALPKGWVGIKRGTLPRAKHAWTFGQLLARLVELDDSLAAEEKRALLSEAVESLESALSSLGLLDLPLEFAACRADLALILSRVDPLRVASALDFRPAGVDAAVLRALESARAAAAKGSPRAFQRSLGILRGATVEMGATPPVLIYGSVSGGSAG
jgi:tetratricopeptide (TPR) repeat protein